VPRVILTDTLKSYGAAKQEIGPGVEHRQHRYLNNRAENSHQPPRQRARRMQGFKSPGHAQRFLAAYGPLANISDRDATASPPRPIDKRWSNASRAGKKSQGSRQRRQRYQWGSSTFLADEHVNMP
jgi:hypothetical protein